MILLPYKTIHFLWRLSLWQHYGSLSDSTFLQESTTGWDIYLLQFYRKQEFYTEFFSFTESSKKSKTFLLITSILKIFFLQ